MTRARRPRRRAGLRPIPPRDHAGPGRTRETPPGPWARTRTRAWEQGAPRPARTALPRAWAEPRRGGGRPWEPRLAAWCWVSVAAALCPRQAGLEGLLLGASLQLPGKDGAGLGVQDGLEVQLPSRGDRGFSGGISQSSRVATAAVILHGAGRAAASPSHPASRSRPGWGGSGAAPPPGPVPWCPCRPGLRGRPVTLTSQLLLLPQSGLAQTWAWASLTSCNTAERGRDRGGFSEPGTMAKPAPTGDSVCRLHASVPAPPACACMCVCARVHAGLCWGHKRTHGRG